eukprot:m.66581 g.66581  ORF g.66581 m.66581 type:complete len:242 (-) comp8194_c1_seq1:60-785(-)
MLSSSWCKGSQRFLSLLSSTQTQRLAQLQLPWQTSSVVPLAVKKGNIRPFYTSTTLGLKGCETYKQGQIANKRREYFYYVDHNGFLFLDDTKMKNFTSQLKDKHFLDFFFKRVERNTSGRHEEDFPYLSRCGRELNFLNCDDTPFVFHSLRKQDEAEASQNGWELVFAGTCTTPFIPEKLTMDEETGRLYHPGINGSCFSRPWLVASKLARELSKNIQFGSSSSKFTWKGQTYTVDIKMDV